MIKMIWHFAWGFLLAIVFIHIFIIGIIDNDYFQIIIGILFLGVLCSYAISMASRQWNEVQAEGEE